MNDLEPRVRAKELGCLRSERQTVTWLVTRHEKYSVFQVSTRSSPTTIGAADQADLLHTMWGGSKAKVPRTAKEQKKLRRTVSSVSWCCEE